PPPAPPPPPAPAGSGCGWFPICSPEAERRVNPGVGGTDGSSTVVALEFFRSLPLVDGRSLSFPRPDDSRRWGGASLSGACGLLNTLVVGLVMVLPARWRAGD